MAGLNLTDWQSAYPAWGYRNSNELIKSKEVEQFYGCFSVV